MLLEEMDKPFSSENYIFEVKFDGIRAIIFANEKGIEIRSRNNKDMTGLFPELESIKACVKGNVIFDSEIVALDDGRPSFSKLQNRMHMKDNRRIMASASEEPVRFVVFDILYENRNLCDEELSERKKVLDKYQDTDVFVKSKVYGSDGVALFKEVKKLKLEGIVAKLKCGKYHVSIRTDDFIKIKNVKVDNFLVCGYVEKEKVVSLLLGEKKSDEIFYVGKVTMGKKNKLYDKLKNARKTKCPFSEELEKANYVKPTYTCRIEYLERTKGGHLRHAVYKGSDEL